MKKLLLAASLILGIGTAASAQNSEALKTKNTKKQTGQPSFTTAAGETAEAKEKAAVAADKAASDKMASDKAVADKPAVEPKKSVKQEAAKPAKKG